MRFPPLAALCLPLALIACSSEEDAGDEALATDDPAAQAGGASALQPGEYQTRVTLLEFEVAGMPESQAESVRSMFASELEKPASFCLTPEQAAQGPDQMVQQMAESNCTVANFDTSSGRVSGEMQCSGEGGLNGSVTVEGTMGANSSSMVYETIHSVPGLPGEGARIRMQVDSRRVGECAG